MDVTPAASWRPPTGTPDTVPLRSPASPPTQALALATLVLVSAALAATVEAPATSVVPVAALVAGVALGLALDVRAAFRVVPGALWATFVFLGLTVVWVWLNGEGSAVTFWFVPIAALFVVGLDWAWAERLRHVALTSGLGIVLCVSDDVAVGAAVGLTWSAVVAATLWSVRRDVLAALPTPAPVPGTGVPPAPARPVPAAVGLLVSWLVAALVVAGAAFALARATAPDRPDPPGASPTSPWRGTDTDGDGLPDTGWDANGDGRADPDLDGDGRADRSVGGNGPTGPGSSVPAAAGGAPMTGDPGAGSSGSSGSSEPSTTPDRDGRDRQVDGARVVAIVLAVVGGLVTLAVLVVLARALAAALARRKARAERPWAERLAERLEREGQRRGRPRRRSEPVTLYAAALAEGVLPDPRLAEVGAAVSAALYSSRGGDAGVGAWAATVVDEVVAAHPEPRRWGGLRSARGARPTPGSAT